MDVYNPNDLSEPYPDFKLSPRNIPNPAVDEWGFCGTCGEAYTTLYRGCEEHEEWASEMGAHTIDECPNLLSCNHIILGSQQ